MGYESKLFIVKKHLNINEDKSRFAEVIAMYDICKFPPFRNLFIKETDCYIYDDCDKKITRDCYGKPLTECAINDVIVCLECELLKDDDYRRIKPLLQMLKGFDLSEWQDGELAVLHYGY